MAVVSAVACPNCSASGLVMMVHLDSGRVFAECTSCHTGFWTPTFEQRFSTRDLPWERREALLDQARGAGYLDLAVQGQLPVADEDAAPEDVAAFLVLDRVPLERVPWWAARWLADGYDGENLRELAGEHGDDPFKIRELLPSALREMQVTLPANAVDAASQTFNYLARRCLTGILSERYVAAMVDHIVAAGGFEMALYDLPLGGIYGLDDEWMGQWGRTDEVLCAEVRRACEEQLATRDDVP